MFYPCRHILKQMSHQKVKQLILVTSIYFWIQSLQCIISCFDAYSTYKKGNQISGTWQESLSNVHSRSQPALYDIEFAVPTHSLCFQDGNRLNKNQHLSITVNDALSASMHRRYHSSTIYTFMQWWHLAELQQHWQEKISKMTIMYFALIHMTTLYRSTTII